MTRRQIAVLVLLGTLNLAVLGVLGVLVLQSGPSPEAIAAATLTALPTATPTPTVTPTPTLPPIALVCQRDASAAMFEAGLLGTVSFSGRCCTVAWIHSPPPLDTLDDAWEGLETLFRIAISLRDQGCDFYDTVVIEISGQRSDESPCRMTVEAAVDDLLSWEADQLSDDELRGRLKVQGP